MGVSILAGGPPAPFAAPNLWEQPAVAAAIVTAVAAIIVLVVNSRLNVWMHRSRLKSDRDLARDHFRFDQSLARTRFALDVRMEDWRRKSAFAEEQLSAFYDARSKIIAIRSPAYGGEAADRPGRAGEPAALKAWRDKYYPVAKRLNAEARFFDELYSGRCRAVALFGREAEAPYQALWRAVVELQVSLMLLMRPDAVAGDPAARRHREAMERIIWQGLAETDVIEQHVNSAVAAAERVFRAVIEAGPG
jgi:hypothetical protein